MTESEIYCKVMITTQGNVIVTVDKSAGGSRVQNNALREFR